MSTADSLTVLNVVIAAIGVMFLIFTLCEFVSLRKLRKDFQRFLVELAAEHYLHQQASHRIIASYGMKDPVKRIAIIKSALERDHSVFNGYNSLGYAYLELGDNLKAADAFKGAIQYHPEDKAGYCDLAYTYLVLGDQALCKEYLGKAIAVDPSAGDDIHADDRFSGII
jgi:tetratricopeptide (TPR) repeat protein